MFLKKIFKVIHKCESPFLQVENSIFKCELGKNGICSQDEKQEGDGRTPKGVYKVCYGFYRPDRVSKISTHIPLFALEPYWGWCDDPLHSAYNKRVLLPFYSSCETLWREDNLYDIILVLSHNQMPVIPYKGSAIFIHCAKKDYSPTQGCIALLREDMLQFIQLLNQNSFIEI